MTNIPTNSDIINVFWLHRCRFKPWIISSQGDGNRVWEKTFGGTFWDGGFSVQQTADNGYVITGYTESYSGGVADVYLIKIDSDGNRVWEKTFGGSGLDWGLSVQQTKNGEYIIAGVTESFGAGGYDVYLIKTDSDGNKVLGEDFRRKQR